MQYDTFNEARQYNALQQLIGATVPGNGATVMNMQYGYSPTQNNGRILQSIDAVLNETVNYTYDSLNRLSTAISTSGSMNQQFSYDGFGNLTGTLGTAVWSFDPSRNAPKGAVDASGSANLAGYQASARFAHGARTAGVASGPTRARAAGSDCGQAGSQYGRRAVVCRLKPVLP
jgi:hypothetical protein